MPQKYVSYHDKIVRYLYFQSFPIPFSFPAKPLKLPHFYFIFTKTTNFAQFFLS